MKHHSEPNDFFDPQQFQRVLSRYILFCVIPLAIGTLFMNNIIIPKYSHPTPENSMTPVVENHGRNQSTQIIGPLHIGGITIGLFAFGGLAVGLVAMGGMAIGAIAFGGGAVGLIAIGGGAVGFIAVGGGAMGFIAIGGGASGVYAMGGSGRGRHVLSYERQDLDAIRFFCRWLPGLRSAFGPSIDI